MNHTIASDGVAMKTQTYVEYLSPGSFVAEGTVRESIDRDAKRAACEAPDHAYGFRFYERVIITAGDVVTRSDKRNVSGVHYVDGQLFDADAVEALPGDHEILLSNMRSNGWPQVVRCRTGGWFQPFGETDSITSAA
jgi:hypothetical protein